jgi:hypothetical protein
LAALDSVRFRGAETAPATFASAERIVLGGMLLVSVPITAGLFPSVALAVVPTTVLAVVGFWLWSKRVSSSGVVPCAIFGGGLVGFLNCGLGLHVSLVLSGQFDALSMAWFFSLFGGIVGAMYGVVYGLIYLPLLLIARRLRALHPSEAFDRTLVSTGLWGLVMLAGALPVADRLAFDYSLNPALVLPFPPSFWVPATVGLLLMLVVGVERLRARRRWLQRVREGQVPGWFVSSPEQFHIELDELPEFCPRLLGRSRPGNLVLAEGETHAGTYRSETPVPRFRVA